MTHPFSQEPVEAALFEALLARRRSLAETGDPLKARRLLKEIKSINHVADLILFAGVSEHMNVACDELMQCGAHTSRVVLASAVLKPTFLKAGKFEANELSKMDGEQAGVSTTSNLKPSAFGGRAGTLLSATELTQKMEEREAPLEQKAQSFDEWMEGRQAPFQADDGQAGVSTTSNPKSSAEGGWTGTFPKMAGKQGRYVEDKQGLKTAGREASFVIRGAETGQIKIELAEGQAGVSTTSNPTASAEGGSTGTLSNWTPTDDVAAGQAPTSPKLNGRLVGRAFVITRPKFLTKGQ